MPVFGDRDPPGSISRRRFSWAALGGALLAPFAARAADRDRPAAGEAKTGKSRILGVGAAALQTHAPVNAMNLYLNGFHFYADDMGRQVEAHHFCTHLTEDLHQCAIFDANDDKARLIGIEYIISARLFGELPEDEQRLWHSHHYEVKSGVLVMPGVPRLAQHAAVADIVTTYGKTFHTWQVDRGDPLPLGIPQLMMGFTRDGQIDPTLVRARDDRLKVSTDDTRRNRADIPTPPVAPGANAWERGRTVQLALQDQTLRNRR